MKKVIAVAIGVLGLLAAAIGVSHAEPGPNDLNDLGLCTAYFNGQKVGHGQEEDQTNQPPPFQGLEDAAEEHTDNDGSDNDNDTPPTTDEDGENEELTDAENIYNYCTDLSSIGGNPEHGRFTCTATDGTDATGSDPDSDPECNENEKPGNGDD